MHKKNFSKKLGIISAIGFIMIFVSCATTNEKLVYRVVECPKEISDRALQYAKMYAARDTVYDWGGQDLLEQEGTLKIDCSGLIVNCYQYAVEGTKYSLMFSDTTVGGLYDSFTIIIAEPRPGDFIFMGDPGAPVPTHMSFYLSTDDENIYFIDATEKDAEGEYPAVNGASVRHYPKDDIRFLSYARLLVRY